MIKSITSDTLQALTTSAQQADRRRANLNIHDTLDANVQRLFIATQPDTYIRPHRHCEAHKWEFFMIVKGSMSLLIFDNKGHVTDRIELTENTVRVVEIPPNTWHSYTCMETNSLALEIKEGCYLPTESKDFADWSPKENSEGSQAYVEWMKHATLGQRASGF